MPGLITPDTGLIKLALQNKCPQCGQASLYETALSFDIRDQCPECELDLSKHDIGDGAVIFLLFILGFLLVPLALLMEWAVSPPLWVHAVLWGLVALGLTLWMMRPVKAYIIALELKHRPETLK